MQANTTAQRSESFTTKRHRRAHTAPMAVGYQLLHLLEQLSLQAIVVADDVGLPLARAGDARLSGMLADAAMWREFSTSKVDDLTLARIRAAYPDVDLEHVASAAVGSAGVQVLAVGPEGTCDDAVRRASEGITRICTTTEGTGPSFLDPASCRIAATDDELELDSRENGVRWAIASFF